MLNNNNGDGLKKSFFMIVVDFVTLNVTVAGQ